MKNLLVILFLVTCFYAKAQVVFKATVDKNPVALGDYFQVTFELDNADGKKFQPPSFDNFSVLQGPSQSSSYQFMNGKTSQSVSYTYVLQPKAIGKFTISPASIMVSGNVLQSNEVKLEVIKGSSSPSAKNNPGGNTSSPQDLSKDIFMVASIDKSPVYQGEQVTLTYKLYTRINVLNMGIDQTPSYKGFWAQDINMPKQQPKTEVYNGQQFTTLIVKKTALFPNETGKLTIDPLNLKSTVQVVVKNKQNDPNNFFNDPFFGNPFGNQVQNLNYTVKSNAVTIDVLPVPDAGKPADYNGAVGEFSLRSKIDTSTLKTDNPIPLSITIAGAGNLKLIDAPKLQLPPDFETYDTKTSENISAESNPVSGSKTYDYLFVPHNPGRFEIAPVNFSYFDPATKQYVVLHTPTYILNIKKGAGTSSTVSSGLSKQDIKLLNEDIRYIKENTTLTVTGSRFAGSPVFYALMILPVLTFGGVTFWLRRERRLSGDVTAIRLRQARKLAAKHLSVAQQFLKQSDVKGFYGETSRAIWGYISNKMNMPTSELSRDNVETYLNEREVSGDTIKELLDVITQCELALYAPSAFSSNMQKDYERAVEIISKLEQEIRM